MERNETSTTSASPETSINPLTETTFFEIDFTNVNFKPNFPFNLVNFDGIFIKNAPNLHNIIEVLQKRFFIRFFNRQASTFILKIDITDIESINPSEVQKLMEKFDKKIFIISFENSNNEDVQIFWKFQDENIFWTRIQKEISKFFLNFLASSMRIDGYCGISANFLSTFQSTEKIFEVDKVALTNSSGLNLLMIAAERGDSNTVNFLLKSGFNVNEKVDEKTAVDLAWDNQHFEIVLQLLRANSQFPCNFEVSLASDGVKKFVNLSVNLQNLILKGNFEEIEKIFKENPTLHHFYSTKNVSASAFALLNGKFDAYEFLISNNVYIGPDENVDEIFRKVSDSRCKDLKKIHLKYLKSFKESHLIILALNSTVDEENVGEKLLHVRKAFKYLDQVDSFISLILQIVAASRDFKINFDFSQSTIQNVNPTTEQKQRSLTEINIAAADLLNSNKVLDVYGIIAYELCLHAMLLVYRNFGCPYYNTDGQKIFFKNIVKNCEIHRESENLINKALNSPSDKLHSELIARIPQIMVKYSNDPIKMEESRSNFSELFKFCKEVVEPELKRKLPTIKSAAEEEVQKIKMSNKKQSKILAMLLLILPLAVWLAVILTKPYIEPFYSCGNLTDELRDNIFESTVDFQGVNVIFGDLFGRNRSACEHLSTQDITKMLKAFDSGMLVENYTGIYRNFTAEENQRIASKVNPKWEIGYKKVVDENLDQSINEAKNQNDEDNVYIKYMKMKFREPSLKIHQKVKTRTKFYVERILKLPNPSSDSNSGIPLGFNRITKMKLLLLSDKGGSGKSTYFRHMAWKLKRRFPLKWISYVDLKQHIDILQNAPKSDANLTTLVDFLSTKILNLTSKVEIEVLRRKFLSNDSIFLWDGVDEVSPMYTDEVLSLIEIVKRLTDNKQWIATRPHLEKQIIDKFRIKALKLEEYNEDDRKEFVTKFMASEGLVNINITKAYESINIFLVRTEKRDYGDDYLLWNTDPQILQIICESYAKDLELSEKTNLYTIYENYFGKKFEEVVTDKGEVVKQDFFKVTELGLFRKIHQHHAIAPIIKFGINNAYTRDIDLYCKDLEIYKSFKTLKDEEVLRFGIVYKQNDRMTFEHRTFKEFFIAQYFLTNIWELTDGSPRDEEANLRLEFLFSILANSNTDHKIVCEFIVGFIEAYSDETDPSFNEVFRHLMLTNYSDLLTVFGDNYIGMNLATKFFKKDCEIINALWKVNENRTFFIEYFEKLTLPNEVELMSKILEENFDAEDKKKILEGKNQAANFLRMTWQKRMNNQSAISFMNIVNFNCDVERLRKIKDFEKFLKYFETQQYFFSTEELREFFIATWNTRAIRTSKERKAFIEYAKKSLTREEFLEISKNWGPSGMLFEFS